jgi:hypothetical protein
MKISNKVSMWIYGLAMVAALINAYVAFKHGNSDAAFAWLCAGGMAGGASGAYMKLKENEDEDNIS